MSIVKQKITETIKKEEVEIDVLDQKIFRFITESKFPMKKIKRLSTLSNDLDILFDNIDTGKILENLDELSQDENKKLRELKSKKKISSKQFNILNELEIKKKGHEYSFKFYGERKNIGFKKKLSSYKFGENYISDNLFRLSVGDDINNSFINCLEELLNLLGKPKSVTDLITNEKLFTPLLFCQLNNGNLVEIFKSDIDTDENFQEWKRKYDTELKSLKITKEFALKNLYSSFTNFKKYHLSDSFKNPEFYLDLLGREGFLFDEKKNIIIVEKTSYDIDSQLNLVCPKSFLGADNLDLEKNSIILINTGQYYEPIIGIRFINRKLELNKVIEPFDPIIDFNILETSETQINRPNITSLLQLMVMNCGEMKEDFVNNLYQGNIENLNFMTNTLDNIDKYIINNNFKIDGILLKNKLYLPIIPSGITSNIIKDIENKNYIKDKLLSITEYTTLVKTTQNISSFLIKNIISFEGKITGALLENGSIVPLKSEDIGRKESIEYNNLDIDNSIMGKVYEIDDRVIFNKDYNNSIFESQKIKYIFNNFIREEENEEIRNQIKKIIVNPVISLLRKKKKINSILANILDELFYFGNLTEKPDIFLKKKSKKCWKLTDAKCIDECVVKEKKCKNFITKKNILTQEVNKNKYINFLQDILLRTPNGIDLITKRFSILSELDVSSSKDELVFPDDMFDYYSDDLFRKKKEKFVRPIDLFNTISQKNNLKLNNSNISKINPQAKTKIMKKKKTKIIGTTQNIFGNKIKKTKIKAGDCIFPSKLILKQRLGSKKKSESKIINDCIPSIPERKTNGSIMGADGLWCPTKIDKTYNKPENYNETGKHKFWKQDKLNTKPYYLYEEKDNNRPKGYCDTREYIKRTIKKTKKINPRCIPEFKNKKSAKTNIPTNYTEDGKEYTCLVENNIDKITDKFTPQLICPTRVDDNGVYDRVNNDNTESCFIDK
tara:strand:+ start:1 stop:2859 length:2859 start_codon:yes stop_codon:yes gene_type:complete